MSSLMDLSNYSGAGGCILAQSYKELWPDLPWFEELGGEGRQPKIRNAAAATPVYCLLTRGQVPSEHLEVNSPSKLKSQRVLKLRAMKTQKHLHVNPLVYPTGS